KSFGEMDGGVEVAGVVTDSKNCVIITGSFTSARLELSETVALKNNGIKDIFMVKYDTLGAISWALSFGGAEPDVASAIHVDGENNIYIAGDFQSNSFTVGSTQVSSGWPENVYAAKFDPDGNLRWLKHSTGLTQTYGTGSTGIFAGEDQKVYMAGFTNSKDISFGEIDLHLNTINSKGFFCRLDKDGNFEMAGLIGDEGDTRYGLNDITVDPGGNIYMAGTKNIHTEPDPVTWQEYRDVMYLCKADPAGTITWEVEDTAFHRAERIICSRDTLFVAGSKEVYRMIFNGGTIDTTSRFCYGAYSLQGEKQWDRSFSGALAYDMYVDNRNIFVMGGLLSDELHLDDFHITRNSDSSSICPIYQDIFMVAADRSGSIDWVESISGSLEDIPTGVWLAGNGDLVYTGIYESARLQVLQHEITNYSELSVFQHVSGTYYDRRIFSFLARHEGFVGPQGIGDDTLEPVRIYPNPSPGWITVDPGPGTGPYHVAVYDLNGRVVDTDQMTEVPFRLDLSDRSPGIYFILVTFEERVIRKPLLIIR
ncbi:MAG: T9SS type A sorting domain-containing protein, partial [Bacteroidota bacterium]